MRRIWWTVHVALLASCGGAGAPRLSDERFVETMTKLHVIDRDASLDSAGRAAARLQVLQAEGLTAEELIAAARRLADHPERARDLFISIDRRVDSLTTDTLP